MLRAEEHAARIAVATIQDLEKDRRARLCGVERTQDHKIAGELHSTVGITRREPEVGDRSIRLKLWIDGKADLASELFIGAGGAELLTARPGVATRDDDLGNGCERRCRDEESRQGQSGPCA